MAERQNTALPYGLTPYDFRSSCTTIRCRGQFAPSCEHLQHPRVCTELLLRGSCHCVALAAHVGNDSTALVLEQELSKNHKSTMLLCSARTYPTGWETSSVQDLNNCL